MEYCRSGSCSGKDRTNQTLNVINRIYRASEMKGPMEPLDKLRGCFIQTFELEPGFDVEGLQYQGIDAWDSVGHMQLIAALETTFDIMIDTQDVLDMSSFNKAKDIVRKHGVGI